jgi:magnesium transporter
MMGRTEEIDIGGTRWVNVEGPTHQDMQVLGERFKLDQLELEDCLSKRQLQKIEHHEDHLFVIIHCPHLSGHSHIVASGQVSIFLGNDYLVTVHQGDLRPIGEIFQSYKNERNRQKSGPGGVLYRILDSLVDSIFPLLEDLMKELDDIEDEVFNEKIQVVRELTTLRRNISAMRRIILPLRRIIAGLYDEMQMRTAELAPKFRDVSDHMEKASAILDEARETVEIYKDTDFTVNTERSNKILAILTIIFTLSIPGTVIGTFYGMNIPLPGGIETGPWLFLGPYTTLIIILLTSVVPALVMLLYFHRLGWL